MTQSPKNQNYSRQEKIAELWKRGILVAWKAHATQKKMAAVIQSIQAKKLVINSSRRIGKSFLLWLIAEEHARKNPHSQIKFAAPTQRMVRKIILPIMRQIQEDCPKHLRPKFHKMDGVVEYQNGAEIHIAGTEMGQVDGLRGTACDLALIDEAGFATDLEYVLESVIVPQTLTRPNAKIILASTPPVSPDHAFVRYAQAAMEAGSYSRYTIYDNPLLTPEQIEEYKKEAGGAESTAWRREYMAEFVMSKDSAIVPEATDSALDAIFVDVERPPFFMPFVSIDLGYQDHTGVIFGYYHWNLGKPVIEDELFVNNKNSLELVNLIRAKEHELWGVLMPQDRLADGQPLVLADLNQVHGFRCRAPRKTELEAGVNMIRTAVGNADFFASPKCKVLRAQLQFGSWDSSRKRFARSASGGHLDVLAAFLYWLRELDRRSNPIPAGYGYDPFNDFGFPRRHSDPIEQTIRTMFPYLSPKGK